MRTDAFDFELPRELIADRPAEPRDSSRLRAQWTIDSATSSMKESSRAVPSSVLNVRLLSSRATRPKRSCSPRSSSAARSSPSRER